MLSLAGLILLLSGCIKSPIEDGEKLNLGSPKSLTINFSNNSVKYPDDSIHISIMGENSSGNLCWVDSTGKLIPVKKADNKYDGYCNYFYRMSSLKSVTISELISARIRFSVGKHYKMKIISENPHAGFTDADWNNPNDPNSYIIYDKIEFTYVNNILYLNTTTVDYFGIPFSVSGKVNNNLVTVGWKASRNEIFNTFKNTAPQDFQKLIQGGYRIVAPHKLLAFNTSYFNTYIDSVWARYKTDSLIIKGTNPDWRAAGKVDQGGVFQFRFTSAQYNNEKASIAKPSSTNVFACDGVGSLKTDQSCLMSHQKLIPKFAGAMNRTVLYGYDESKSCDTSTFYRTGNTNWFSKIFHLCALNNKCYGFPYDDDCEQSSLFPNGNVTELNIVITKFE